MSRHGFRFVHATCLCLDEHLAGTGSLSPEDRELAEDATFLAWDGIVNTALSTQADFLLLTGNSFNLRTSSLRSRVALEKGFEKLAAHHISVFIAAGVLDPVSAWRRHVHLPPNVTLLETEDQEPVAVMRDNQVLASLCIVASCDSDESSWSTSGPAVLQRSEKRFRIGLVPAGTPIEWVNGRPEPISEHGRTSTAARLVQAAIEQRMNYIALGDGQPRTEQFTHAVTHAVAHDPGCAQALSGEVTGSRGCSVVEVGANDEIRIDLVAVAPVRWEQVDLVVEPHTNWNDLSERMALAMMDRVADNDERLWIVNWRISGHGQIFDGLASPDRQAELWKLVEAELASETDVRRAHRLERVGRGVPHVVVPVTHSPVASGMDAAPAMHPPVVANSELFRDFDELLEQRGAAVLEQVLRELATREGQDAEFRHIREAAQQASPPRILKKARALAARWLG